MTRHEFIRTGLHVCLSAAFVACGGAAAFAGEAPKGMKLFLLIGQSNMAGRGKVEPADKTPHPRVFMLNKANAWVPAQDPVHFDKPKSAGVGLCSEFARCVAAQEPETVVGLIPCAFGGTSLDQWKPGSPLYNTAVARARVAQKNGTLAGILWHQGESDSTEWHRGKTEDAKTKRATYPARFAAMISQLRNDLGAGQVPVVVGELGRFGGNGFPEFNAVWPEVTKTVPRCALASSEGLGDNKDKVHFSRAALIEFGKRYFEAYRKLEKTAPTSGK